ncbi:ABC transporter permease [Serratia sp. JSRIV001]|jgi:peptide/nickel transport system permease protein|uniref:ABC transporter permease n=1 Tax=Serratia TaxID=613 RepID=UPI00192D0BEF|nr:MULTISPECIES: ABC transporter permease [Serratia]MBL5828166.1 ABC transporter permease [Serratia fonticola]UAN44137.1 ABC transporter permease [Serratia sp. JSRIV001]CAI1607111.1 Glutathione transport system permease protein gsiC [Serratia fonticola]CAI1823607.1 Glutathione transport system permease protein gsiC [Serratia fonticola]CAI2479144.1 Glutathione transport system permease protein gsiC [Serratia fonticola]
MLKYLSGRTGQALLVLWAAFTLSFILLQVLPGDAILIKFQNPDMGLSPDQIADMRAAYGADVPLWQQYLHTLGNFLRGDLGYSIQNGVPVSALLAANLPATLQLAVLGFTLALLLALVIAFVSNLIGFGWLKSALQSLPALFVSVPTFWLGIVLIQIFSFRLKLVPIINPGEWIGLLLPIATLAIPISAPLAQILIRSIDSVQTQPFVAVARAKGASRSGVLWRHVARNAMLPVLTIAGILFGELIAGALITETVFGRSGLGQLTQQAVVNQDVAVLQAVVMISAAAFVFLNLLVDLLFPLLDPRLKTYAGATR